MSLIIAEMLRRSTGGDMPIDKRTAGPLRVGPPKQPDAPSPCWVVKIERERKRQRLRGTHEPGAPTTLRLVEEYGDCAWGS